MKIDYGYAIIGSLMTDPSLVNEIDLVPEDFQVESYQIIYQTILTMITANQVVDLITVSAKLDKAHPNENWLTLLGQSIRDCADAKNIAEYAKIIKRESDIKKVHKICTSAIDNIKKAENHENVIDTVLQELIALTSTKQNHESSMSQAMRKALDAIDAAHNKEGIVGITTGIDKLDAVIGGFHGGNLIVVGARASVGKTAVMGNLANAHTESAGIISAEQSSEQIAARLISINGRVNSSRMRNGTMEDFDFNKLSMSVKQIHENNNLRINDKPGISITDVIRQARQWKHRYDIKILYLDYIQRIKWPDQNLRKWERVGNVVMALKELARDLNIPVVALAQINREAEKQKDKRPTMDKLADSSEIEKEADVIMLLYRDELYDPDSRSRGIMEINVCKNRHGPIGTTDVAWNGKYMRIDNIVPQHYVDKYTK